MDFKETEAYLLSLGNEVSAMKLGLDNIRRLLAELGDPQKNYLKVQVAGTNGKGSVCAFLNSICVTAGIRTGMFTSPHLISMTERVKIDGVDISEDEFATLATRVREVSESLTASGEIGNVPTYFEQVTAIALLAFAEVSVELAILETGLGGRLDATTAANSEIAAITRIDIDHQQYLGETIEEIAAEKAAIIHEGSRVVIGEQVPEAMRVIVEKCREVGVDPKFASEVAVVFPPLGILGRHQIENARIAAAATQLLRSKFQINDEHVTEGLQKARHAGRLEWIGKFLLDGAHNIGGARALAEYLDASVTPPITLVFGAMSDKQLAEIAAILFPRADRLILTTPDNSRAARAKDLLQFVPTGIDADRVLVAENPLAAIDQARGTENVVVVTGSLYLVGEVRRILISNSPEKLKTDN